MSEGIGERLREARAARGIELEDAERQIKIRKRFLVAMEEEQWDVLPGDAYVRGFLHTYAELLGLDADAVVDEYRRAERARRGAEAESGPAPTPAPTPAAEPPGVARGSTSRRMRAGPWVVVAGGVAAVLALLLVLGITGGDDGGDDARQRAKPAQETAPATEPAEEKAEEEPPARVKLELTAAADVWVCLLDDDGAPVIEGVTVPAGESEGPFRSRRFELTLGNGQVELVANGEPVEIPSPADPVGYRITPDRTSELDETERPTCA